MVGLDPTIATDIERSGWAQFQTAVLPGGGRVKPDQDGAATAEGSRPDRTGPAAQPASSSSDPHIFSSA